MEADGGARWNEMAAWVTEGRLNDPIEWSAPLSLRLPRISISSSTVNLTSAAKRVYLKSDRTSLKTPGLGSLVSSAGTKRGSVSAKNAVCFIDPIPRLAFDQNR